MKLPPPLQYRVQLHHTDGTTSILAHKDRTAWSYRIAMKHLLDITSAKLNKGQFPNVEHFSILEI